jgi:prepilin-type processing-associated H-X9-DG protein
LYDKLDQKYSLTYRGAITSYAVPIQAEDGFARSFGYDVKPGDEAGLASLFPSPIANNINALAKIKSVWNSPGIVEFSARTPASQVTDGLSHTFILTEVAGRPEHWLFGQHVSIAEPLPSAWADPRIALQISGTEQPGGGKCIMQCDNNNEIYSFHPNGVNFLFADGHVQFVDASVDGRTILTWLTPAQGEIPSQ